MFELRSMVRVAPIAAVGAAVAASPILGSESGPVLCASRAVLHFACPFCGLTRGVAEIARGDLAASWAMHPFSIILLLEAVTIAALMAFLPPPLIDRLRTVVGPALGSITVLGMAALWVVRLRAGTLPPL